MDTRQHRLQAPKARLLTVALAAALTGCAATPASEDCPAGRICGSNDGEGGNGGSSTAPPTPTAPPDEDASAPDPPPPGAGERVVGYLPTYRGLGDWTGRIDFSRLTHLNVAFANPREGNQPFVDAEPGEFEALIAAAHAAGTRVLISLGGAGQGSARVQARITPDSVDGFVAALASYVDQYELDGIDVDIEGDPIDANYGPFISKLVATLRPQNKLVTSALATWFTNKIDEQTFLEFDFINVMAYDHCGSWTEPCEHSTIAGARQDLNHFALFLGVPKHQLTLGVPFYGHCWGTTCPSSAMTYDDILGSYPEAWQSDWIEADGRQISYNGEDTLRDKAALAQEYGGVMIWELGQDTLGERSLLNAVSQ